MTQALGRRTLLQGALLSAAGLAVGRADAAVFRALSLEELLAASNTVSVVRALAAECHYETFGATRRIVTDTRVQLSSTLGGATAESEFVIRSLGGVVGERGEFVAGQATLTRGKRAVVFLGRSAPGSYFVVGMAQGHFPLLARQDGVERLALSPNLPRLLRSFGVAAGARLVDRTADEAAILIREARR